MFEEFFFVFVHFEKNEYFSAWSNSLHNFNSLFEEIKKNIYSAKRDRFPMDPAGRDIVDSWIEYGIYSNETSFTPFSGNKF